MQLRLLLLSSLAVAAPLAAQDYRADQIDEAGIKFVVNNKLARLPLKLGQSHPNLLARYAPDDEGDFIWGKYGAFKWELKIYAFEPRVTTGARASGEKAAPPKTATERMAALQRATNFDEFVRSGKKDPDFKGREFRTEAKERKKNKARGGPKLPYRWWEYTDTSPMFSNATGQNFDQLWYNCAAAYDVDGREIVLVTHMPVKRGTRLDAKYMRFAQTMLLSVTTLKDKEKEGEGDTEALMQFADTPEREEAVQKAMANVANLDRWGIFTTPNYIVLYSWDKPDKRRRFQVEAKDIAAKMDLMREKYKELYPPHEKMKIPYSVMRICSDASEFHKYSTNTSPGVIGWFSPMTKELVLFVGRRDVLATAFHEGWHQYSDAYFGGVELHRWFDEGTGDYFGSYERKGRRWIYDVSKMRKMSIKTMVSTKSFAPINEIVTWSRDKFYGANAANWYAQGYSIVDFLRNGSKNRRLWNEDWANILETYRAKLLQTKNAKKSVQAAFEGVDWEAFEKAWVAWVKGY